LFRVSGLQPFFQGWTGRGLPSGVRLQTTAGCVVVVFVVVGDDDKNIFIYLTASFLSPSDSGYCAYT
jgi:hypothetical protein